MAEASIDVLVRIAVAMARRDVEALDVALEEAASGVDATAVEETLLQSYLFLGFPATLDGLRRWRRRMPTPAPDADVEHPEAWAARGPDILKRVYGGQAERLRDNVRALHPALERWMVQEGYGKVLGRPGLTLIERELLVSSQLAVLGPSPQLYSHLRGALRVGATADQIEAVLEAALSGGGVDAGGVRDVWARVQARVARGATRAGTKDSDESGADPAPSATSDPKGV